MTPAPQTRARLAPRPVEFHGYVVEAVLRQGDRYKARVMLGNRGDQRVVIKDLSPMRPFARSLFGRRMLRREARALAYLDGFALVPKLIEKVSEDAIAIEFVNSIYLRKKLARHRKPAVFASLKEAVRGLHERGVVHFDLRQRKNILVRRDDRVMLIDFESALVLGRSSFGKWATRIFSPIDRYAVLKWQAKFLPMMLSKAERRSHERFQRVRQLWFFKSAVRRLAALFGRNSRRSKVNSGRASGGARSQPETA